MDEMRRLLVDLHKTSDQKLNSSMREIKANIKGINVHLDDLETWKRGVDSRLGHLASAIPRASGNLSGKTEENPRAHIAAVMMRSEREAQPGQVDITKGDESSETGVPSHQLRKGDESPALGCGELQQRTRDD